MHLAVSLHLTSSFTVDISSPISRNRITMTVPECDSTNYTAPCFQDGTHHANGCTRIGAPCSSSLLRLALIAGSAYAVRFSTCIVNVSPSRRRRRVEWSKRTYPYQRKNKHSELVLRSISPNEQNVQDVTSSTDLSFGDRSRIESTIKRQTIDDFEPGLSKSSYVDEKWKELKSTQGSLKPLRIISEAEDQRCAEKYSLPLKRQRFN